MTPPAPGSSSRKAGSRKAGSSKAGSREASQSPSDADGARTVLAESWLDQARQGRLYPSVILYGGDVDQRRESVLCLARALLCARPPEERGCDPESDDACTHCRRLRWPEKGMERFHPDLHVLERDLRTSTSVAATKAFANLAIRSPFEARGQVFVVAEADTLGGGGADALLKLLEEPPERSPRHFFLLAASRQDLSTTLRSRSLAIYLGHRESLDDDEVADLMTVLGPSLDGYFRAGSALHLLTAADALGRAKGFDDPRARRPWATAAAALVRWTRSDDIEPTARRQVLDLAAALLEAPRLRLRGIPPQRILEGLLSRHLAG